MNIHKNLRYLLVGCLALTSLVSYSNDTRGTLEEQKAKLEAKLKTLQEENPGINIKKPGFFTKIGHVVSLSLLGGAFDVCVGPADNIKKSNYAKYFILKAISSGISWAPGAIAVVYDIPKIVTHTRFTEGHIVNKRLEEGYDSRSAARVLAVFLGSRLLITKVILPIASVIPSHLGLTS